MDFELLSNEEMQAIEQALADAERRRRSNAPRNDFATPCTAPTTSNRENFERTAAASSHSFEPPIRSRQPQFREGRVDGVQLQSFHTPAHRKENEFYSTSRADANTNASVSHNTLNRTTAQAQNPARSFNSSSCAFPCPRDPSFADAYIPRSNQMATHDFGNSFPQGQLPCTTNSSGPSSRELPRGASPNFSSKHHNAGEHLNFSRGERCPIATNAMPPEPLTVSATSRMGCSVLNNSASHVSTTGGDTDSNPHAHNSYMPFQPANHADSHGYRSDANMQQPARHPASIQPQSERPQVYDAEPPNPRLEARRRMGMETGPRSGPGGVGPLGLVHSAPLSGDRMPDVTTTHSSIGGRNNFGNQNLHAASSIQHSRDKVSVTLKVCAVCFVRHSRCSIRFLPAT
jgi:hypothetical protein